MARPFAMRILSKQGIAEVEVSDFWDRSDIGLHWNAVQRLLNTGRDDELKPFAGRAIAGHELETDPKRITRWAKQGELDFEDIYGTA